MKSVFIANRGEIAARVLRSVQAAGMTGAVAFPEVDHDLPYVEIADIAVPLAEPKGFSDVDTMIAAALDAGADALHPGYGFLSENPALAEACEKAGLVFIGPRAETIAVMGDKAESREVAQAHGVPTPSGSAGAVESVEHGLEIVEQIGFPVMIKAAAGGGGIAMSIARDADGFTAAFEQVSGRAQSVFGDGRLIVERYIARSRHIEVQVMGLPDGSVVTFGERDCSVQRRHQKVIEESPSPALTPALRAEVRRLAGTMAEAVGYLNAGTVEFIFDLDTNESYFLEMNTRLQVEHPVTEVVHGVDLVAWQLQIAQGISHIPDGFTEEPQGHAMEFRVYAEDPKRFFPKPGVVTTWQMPEGEGVRVEAGYREGNQVSPFFDPLMAKIIVSGSSRDEVLARSRTALATTQVVGPACNVEFMARVLDDPRFARGDYDTGIVARLV